MVTVGVKALANESIGTFTCNNKPVLNAAYDYGTLLILWRHWNWMRDR